MAKKGGKSKEPEIKEDVVPPTIECFPTSFITEVHRRRDEKDYMFADGVASVIEVNKFLAELVASPDWAYNHFRVWLHRLVSDWRAELLEQSAFEDAADNEYVILLWLWLLNEFVRTFGVVEAVADPETLGSIQNSQSSLKIIKDVELVNSAKAVDIVTSVYGIEEVIEEAEEEEDTEPDLPNVGLVDFAAFVHDNMERMGRDFRRIGWFCLLSVLDAKDDVIAVEESVRSSKEKVSSSSKNSSKSHVSKSRASQVSTSSPSPDIAIALFQAQLAVLTAMLCRTFPYSCQFEMLVQMMRPRQERLWQELPSAEHRLQIVRAFYDAKKMSANISEIDRCALLLPLNMSEDIDDTFWEELFAEVET